jgi:DNA-binding transcriptional regulator YiaG
MDRMTLKAWRRDNELTQQEAADLLGTTKTSVYRWESGQREPIPDTVARLVVLLGHKKNVRRLREFLSIPLAI